MIIRPTANSHLTPALWKLWRLRAGARNVFVTARHRPGADVVRVFDPALLNTGSGRPGPRPCCPDRASSGWAEGVLERRRGVLLLGVADQHMCIEVDHHRFHARTAGGPRPAEGQSSGLAAAPSGLGTVGDRALRLPPVCWALERVRRYSRAPNVATQPQWIRLPSGEVVARSV